MNTGWTRFIAGLTLVERQLRFIGIFVMIRIGIVRNTLYRQCCYVGLAGFFRESQFHFVCRVRDS